MNLKLVTATGIAELWGQIGPLLDKCVKKAFHGESTADDIRALVERGDAILAVGFGESGTVDIVAAMEPVYYPRMRTINVFALGGRTAGVMARLHETGFIDALKGWAKENGFDAMDAWTSLPMARFINRFGFEPKYIHNRVMLGESQ